MFKFIILGASTLALATMPVAASAAATASPVVAQANRASAPVNGENNLAGGTGQVVPLVILAGIIGAVAYLVVDHENDRNDRPNSP